MPPSRPRALRRPFLLLALLAGAPAACADEPTGPTERELAQARTVYRDALGAIEDGLNLEAIELLDDAVALDPAFEEAHRARVVFGARVAHFDEVIESAEWLLERYPDERDLLLDLARAGLQSGRVDVTRGALRRLRDMDPDSAQVEALWARLFFELGDFEAAETHAWRSATLVPEQTTAHHIIGLAAENRGDLIAAIEAYRKVIFVDPGHLGARDHLATCLLRDGRRKESNRHREIHTALIRAMPPGFRHFPATERIATLGELVELLPEWDVGHLELGRALMQDGRLVEARAAVERALAARQSPESHELMATILRRLGEHELARRHGEKAGVPWEDGAE